MPFHRLSYLFVSLVLLVACGGGDDEAAPDGSTTSDGAVDANTAVDGSTTLDGSMGTCITAGTGTTVGTSDGVLTNQPQANFSPVTGVFTIRTANIFLRTTDVDTDIIVYGEYRNDAAVPHCTVFADMYVGGLLVEGLGEGTAHRDSGSSSQSSKTCIAAGATAPFWGVESDVSTTLLSGTPNITFDFESSTFASGTNVSHTGTPAATITSRGAADGCGSIVNLTATTSISVYNYAVSIFPRDSRGLLVDRRTAYAANLADVPASSMVSFSTLTGVFVSNTNVLVPSFLVRNNARSAASTETSAHDARRAALAVMLAE